MPKKISYINDLSLVSTIKPFLSQLPDPINRSVNYSNAFQSEGNTVELIAVSSAENFFNEINLR
jgi:hypothetical protein